MLAFPAAVFLPGCGTRGRDADASEPKWVSLAQYLICMDKQEGAQNHKIGCDDILLGERSRSVLYGKTQNVGIEPIEIDNKADRYSFNNATSLAILPSLQKVAPDAQALSFWITSDVLGRMKIMQLTLQGGGTVVLESNVGCGLLVRAVGANIELAELGMTGAFTNGVWHHVLFQFRCNSLELIVDGAWRVSINWSNYSIWSMMQFGGDVNFPWIGMLGTVRLYDRTFSAKDSSQLAFSWRNILPSTRADSFVAYFPFNGDAMDETGNKNDGTVHAVQPSVDRFGNQASALNFSSSDSFIELDKSIVEVAEEFALAMWVRSVSTMSMDAFTVASGERLMLNIVFNAGAGIRIESFGAFLISAGEQARFTDGQWHFVLLQRLRDSTLELFVDNVLQGNSSLTGAMFGLGSRVRIGHGFDGSANYGWKGEIDDVQIYVRTFTASEMQDLMWMQFRPKDGVGALVLHDRLWLLGGWSPEVHSITDSEVWSSSDGVTWKLECRAPWEGRHTAGWLTHRNMLWVLGGDRIRGHYQNDVWNSPDGVHWDKVCDNPPWAGRVLFMYATFNDRLWIFGGMKIFEEPGLSEAYNDIYSSVDGVDWKLECAQAPWSPRGIVLGSAVFRNKLWVIGGGVYDGQQRFNDVWCSTDGRSWECILPSAPWEPRTYHNVVVYRGLLWVIGGTTSKNPSGLNDVWFSQDGVQWHHLTDTPWPVRHAASVAVWRDKLWFGCGSSSRLYNDLWVLN